MSECLRQTYAHLPRPVCVALIGSGSAGQSCGEITGRTHMTQSLTFYCQCRRCDPLLSHSETTPAAQAVETIQSLNLDSTSSWLLQHSDTPTLQHSYLGCDFKQEEKNTILKQVPRLCSKIVLHKLLNLSYCCYS